MDSSPIPARRVQRALEKFRDEPRASARHTDTHSPVAVAVPARVRVCAAPPHAHTCSQDVESDHSLSPTHGHATRTPWRLLLCLELTRPRYRGMQWTSNGHDTRVGTRLTPWYLYERGIEAQRGSADELDGGDVVKEAAVLAQPPEEQ